MLVGSGIPLFDGAELGDLVWCWVVPIYLLQESGLQMNKPIKSPTGYLKISQHLSLPNDGVLFQDCTRGHLKGKEANLSHHWGDGGMGLGS